MTAELQAVVGRLEKVEGANRKLKWAGLAALVAVGTLAGYHVAAPSRTVEAHKFVLKDAKGRTRAMLESTPNGSALQFFDASGRMRADFGMYGEPGLELLDENGKLLGVLAASSDRSVLVLSDATGHSEAALNESKFEGPSLHLTKDRKVLWSAP